jgi:hypothetical protein
MASFHSAIQEYMQKKATNPADGVAKGLLAFGYGFAKGIKGLVVRYLPPSLDLEAIASLTIGF